jgi:hypothetical protein
MNPTDELFNLLATGPRNLTAYQIATMVRDGKEDEAKNLYSWDGDKVATTVYQPAIQKLLGCRLHNVHDCDAPFCKPRK